MQINSWNTALIEFKTTFDFLYFWSLGVFVIKYKAETILRLNKSHVSVHKEHPFNL